MSRPIRFRLKPASTGDGPEQKDKVEDKGEKILKHPSLPHHFATKRFNYHFHDRVHHAAHGGVVKLLRDDHHLRLTIPLLPNLSSKLKFSGGYPAKISLRSHVKKILNQGNMGACVSHSAAQALHIVMERVDASRSTLSRFTSSAVKFWASRLYIYDNARRIDGTPLSEDAGTTNVTACMAIDQYKVCPEDMWPYTEHNLTKLPPHQAYIAANQYKTFEYSRVDADIEAFKAALVAGHPIMVGVTVFPSLVRSGLDGGSGVVPIPDESRESPIGGHSLLVIGYDDEKELFTFVNHWGSEWGDEGFGYLPYKYLMDDKYCGDFFAIMKFA